MKNKNLEILIENVNENFSLNITDWTDIAKKLFFKLLSYDEINKNSCLQSFKNDFESIYFDITFTNAQDTHELNKEYRNKDYPADIITFAIFADDENSLIIDNRIVLGDIILALDKVNEMAESEGKNFDYMLKFLTAHGILHLLGFDHQTEDEYNFVVKYQNKAIEDLVND